jgi:hypothetical protein
MRERVSPLCACRAPLIDFRMAQCGAHAAISAMVRGWVIVTESAPLFQRTGNRDENGAIGRC